MAKQAFTNAQVFDGTRLQAAVVLVEDGLVLSFEQHAPKDVEVIDLQEGYLLPGFVDLQVNGGGGVMLNDVQSLDDIQHISNAHQKLGATSYFPTLITDTPENTKRVVNLIAKAIASKVPGIAGLHLEGPHLSIDRKGAHDPKLIRPMTDTDLEFLIETAQQIPKLLITIALEAVTHAHINALSNAGIIISIGHSEASFEQTQLAVTHGVSMVTHLFNAMSQLGNREPGLVGSAFAFGELNAGIIADGLHVHPATIATAMRAKVGPGKVFLVSDAMAFAGTSLTTINLNGRKIFRQNGKLTLADGTLAGADLDMATAIRVMVEQVGVSIEQALAMATRIPAQAVGLDQSLGVISAGRKADFVHLSRDFRVKGVYQNGHLLTH
jgi:N-acetylglucosamine-6-phosphate deacetylase